MCAGLLGGGPFTFDGTYHAADGAVNTPPALQQPRPPMFVGGKGDRLLDVVAELADGWNTCWGWTVDAYRERTSVLDRACEARGRDPESVTRSLGLYALCGEDERDLAQRFERLRATTPPGVLDGVTLDDWRVGHLVGTVDEVREQAVIWESLGVESLILGVGAVPFAVTIPTTSNCSPPPCEGGREPRRRVAWGRPFERVAPMNLGVTELLIILGIVLLVFGSTRLPKLARSLGEASKEFKKGTRRAAADRRRSQDGRIARTVTLLPRVPHRPGTPPARRVVLVDG